jgi:hypothetical protein
MEIEPVDARTTLFFFFSSPESVCGGMHGVKRQKPGERDEAKEAVMRVCARARCPPGLARNANAFSPDADA